LGDSNHLKSLDEIEKEEQAMNKEDLKKLGLTDDAVIDQIIVLHGKDIEGHKAKITTAQTELDGVKKQLTDANAQIESFKGMDIEGVKKSADEWKTKAEQAQAEAAAPHTTGLSGPDWQTTT
jgi:hypothetical protein